VFLPISLKIKLFETSPKK
jgi:hypothetical protein